MLNAFEVFDLPVDASEQVVKAAYRRLILENHPDKGGSAERFRAIQDAYKIMLDADSRQRLLKSLELLLPAPIGAHVGLRDLRSEPELNGVVGTLIKWDGLRCQVQLHHNHRIVSVKPTKVFKSSVNVGASAWSSSSGVGSSSWWSGGGSSATASGPGASSSSSAEGTGWSSTSATGTSASAWSWTEQCTPQEGEVLKPWPGGGGSQWPFCEICRKWSGADHRSSRRHQNNVAWLKSSPSAAPDPHQAPPPPRADVIPEISHSGWTSSETAAASFLASAGTPAIDLAASGRSIYEVFDSDSFPFEEWSSAELLAKARVVQLGMMLCKGKHLDELRRDAHSGKGCMEKCIDVYDWTAGQPLVEQYYVKTAGDLLQGNWLWKHRLDTRFQFTYNQAQAECAQWLQLDYCLLGTKVSWNEHAVADLCEAATLYLPPGLAHAYLSVLANYHKLRGIYDVPRCEHASGKVPCGKACVPGKHFCALHAEY